VLGADGSPAGQAAITFAFEEAALRAVPLVTVCALTDAPGRLGGSHQVEEDFEHAVAVAAKEHPEVRVDRHVLVGTPRAALLSAAAEAQLLVVGARGRGGFDEMSLAPSRRPCCSMRPARSRSFARPPKFANFSWSQA
jgi:nucleotide-binding universal stress UspA family protein